MVARDNETVTDLMTSIDDLGIDIDEEVLVKGENLCPANVFEPGRPEMH